MENLIDFYTGLTIEKINVPQFESNIEQVEKRGVYLGHIGDKNAAALIEMGNELNFLQHQIDLFESKI